MARTHRMTPARRAALRKAQLASARKRRKNGVGSQVRRASNQSFQRARANASLKGSRRKIIRRAAYGAVVAGVAASALAGSRTESFQVHRGVAKSSRKKQFSSKAQKVKYQTRVRPLVRHNVRRAKGM